LRGSYTVMQESSDAAGKLCKKGGESLGVAKDSRQEKNGGLGTLVEIGPKPWEERGLCSGNS